MEQQQKIKENEIKKLKDRKLIKESDNKLTEYLFSDNPNTLDDNISIIKLEKNKFVSVINKKIPTKPIEPIKQTQEIKIDKTYDLNDYDYDYADDF